MFQRVTVAGYLGKDPEVRATKSGEVVTNFSIATSEKWKDKSGERQERTEWFNCVAFGKTAELAGQYLKKGSVVLVEAKLRTEKWTDKEGAERTGVKFNVDKLTFLPDGKGRDRGDAVAAPETPAAAQQEVDFSDDVPF